MMDADALHEAFPFTEELVFNEARFLEILHSKYADRTCHAQMPHARAHASAFCCRYQDAHPAHPIHILTLTLSSS